MKRIRTLHPSPGDKMFKEKLMDPVPSWPLLLAAVFLATIISLFLFFLLEKGEVLEATEVKETEEIRQTKEMKELQSLMELSAETRSSIGLGLLNFEYTFLVVEVKEGSPAERAGIAVRDTILSLDGENFEDAEKLLRYLKSKESGSIIRFEVLTGEERRYKVVKVKLPLDS